MYLSIILCKKFKLFVNILDILYLFGIKYSYRIIIFKRFIWSIDETLVSTTTLGQSGTWSNGNEGILYTSKTAKPYIKKRVLLRITPFMELLLLFMEYNQIIVKLTVRNFGLLLVNNTKIMKDIPLFLWLLQKYLSTNKFRSLIF